MDNQTFQKIKDLINQHQSTGVLVGPNPSLDEMAAGLGMYLVLLKMGKDASVVCPTDPNVGISSLVGIDRVQKSFAAGGGNGDLTVSFPYKEGEIEKVSYTLDGGKLNIQVKAGPQGLNFQQSDVQFVRASAGGAAPSLVFMIGISHPQAVASVFDINANPTTSVINIDNKEDNEKYGTALNVSSRFSSVSEEVADFVTLLEPQVELDVDTCQNLMTGILYATKEFTAPNTSYLAFEMAGILMKKGAKRSMPATSQPNTVANPAAYFPPTSNVAGAQQPLQQPVAPVQPMQVQQPVMPQTSAQPMMPPFDNAQGLQQVPQQEYAPMQNPVMQQPVSQPMVGVQQFNQPMPQPVMQPQPITEMPPFGNAQGQQAPVMQPAQPQQPQETPADWLTPKVYKGSTVL